MPKYTMVNQKVCAACASCEWIVPEVYKVNQKEGKASCILDNNQGIVEVPEKFHELIEEAYAHCPTGAIRIANEPFHGDPLRFS